MALLVVAHHESDPIEELGRGQAQAPPGNLAERKPVTGPDRERANDHGKPEPGRAFPGEAQQLAPARSRYGDIEKQRQGRGAWQVEERRKLRQHREPDRQTQPQTALPRRRFRPQHEREESRAKTCGQRHIGGGQAGVCQHRRQQGKQPRSDHADGVPEMMPGPEVHHQAGQEKEGQNSEAHQVQNAVGIARMEQYRHGFLPAILFTHGPRPSQVRSQCNHGPGQRRMLRLVLVQVLGQIFRAASEIPRFIDGHAEDRVRGRNPAGGDGDQT